MISQAMYLSEDIDDKVIGNIIKLAEEYRGETNISVVEIETGHLFLAFFDEKIHAIEFRTPFFEILNIAHKEARKYQEADQKEIDKILSRKTIILNQVIYLDKESDVDADDLYVVLKVPQKENEFIGNRLIQCESRDISVPGEILYFTPELMIEFVQSF